MARPPKLTWSKGSGNRRGRWRVRYKGKAYYFNGGRGKSDRDARKVAEQAWQRRKLEIDADLEAEKPHRQAYEELIAEWSNVRQWSVENDDPTTVQLADAKIEVLRTRLAGSDPPPLNERDRFQPLAKQPYRFRDASAMLDLPDGVRLRLVHSVGERAVWEERLKSAKVAEKDFTFRTQFDDYLALQDSRVKSGQISVARYEQQRSHLTTFMNTLGESFNVTKLSPEMISLYFDALSSQVAAREISPTTASDKWGMAKRFVRWLWSRECIPELPRNLDSKDYKFARPPRKISTLSVDQIHTVLARPTSDRTRLYVLLMLNCGFTQIDLSDLTHEETDLKGGYITRKRSKTQEKSSVPEVRYQLWSETVELLRKEAATNSERVLLNSTGGPLRTDVLTADGKYRKTDNVRSAWQRVCQRTGLKASLTSLRKTSATLLRSQPKYATIYSYFLGHAPTTVADRHYAAAPEELLHKATAWLHQTYQISAAMTEDQGSD